MTKTAICVLFGIGAAAAASGAEGTRTALERKFLTDSGTAFSRFVYDEAFNRVVQADRNCDEDWLDVKTPEDLRVRQDLVRRKAIDALGGFPERTPLNAKVTGTVELGSCRMEKVVFESRPGFFVTGHLYIPSRPGDKGPFPALLAPCGHSLAGKSAPWYSNTGVFGAARGFVVLVYDPVDQGERYQKRDGREAWSTTAEHNNMGARAFLLGESAAQVRIYDGMRAIDYLISRKDVVRPDKIAVAGISGGGTLSSYINAFDPRVACASPSGFLSTIRDVYDNCGPQDAEQVIFGQLAFGLNHLGIVCLRAPSPILVSASHSDFFPFMGTTDLVDKAKKVFRTAGAADKVGLVDVPGAHHWYAAQKDVQFGWMARWMTGDDSACPKDFSTRYRDFLGYDYEEGRGGISGDSPEVRNVTPHGKVLELPGARSIYDIYRDRLAELKAKRPPLGREAVRRLTGIADSGAIVSSRKDMEGGFVLFRHDDRTMIPVLALTSGGKGDKPSVLIVSDAKSRTQLEGVVDRLLGEGRDVFVADVRGFGETSESRHAFYGSEDGDEEIAGCMMALGDSLVARRAEDVLLVARHLRERTGRAVALRAEGRAVIPAVHACYLEPDAFAGLELDRQPPAWAEVVGDETKPCPFANCVRGALRQYDWVDLLANR